ncbi:YgfZ/GcvT domain-containing protein [Pararhizobium antarcticum]|uniref:Aminomethyltransferase n=1 Tax=Pararhizobium antarcticum TaxID=1798805 RepID=A0A657LNJ3_9HYPH|nr:folate-binding protein YgfZ [Pararhizobium antarcticum]OJF92887.1 aminomethyltransferase [Pararhizobium antarcticum]OJF97730.1 aminomethyltransferase [Rhizobium sp. 58]
MHAPTTRLLSGRAVITVSGPDAESFLQNLITTDLGHLAPGEVLPGALLTPQGKILFDFLVSRDGEAGIRLETSVDQGEGLLKRLTMYKLRAPVTLVLASPAMVAVTLSETDGENGLRDMRFAKAGETAFRRYEAVDGGGGAAIDGYERLRIESGIAVSGADYALQDAFPHDVLLDLNGGLSFRKGCYVGQEVVSRMQHRGTARRRVVIVRAPTALPETGTAITVNGRPIGTLGTVLGQSGLAIVRIDKAGEAIETAVPILAGDVSVTLTLPAWSGLTFPTASEEASA